MKSLNHTHNPTIHLTKEVVINGVLMAVTLLLLTFVGYAYYTHFGQFSFVDEFNSIVVAYFMLKGRQIYSEIFHNHQMLMPVISYGIQKVLHPQTFFQLIVYHRLFVLVFGFVANILLMIRFKKIGMLFAIFYELSKFYAFGHLFQAESLIVYPLVYLFLLSWQRRTGKVVSSIEMYIAGLCFLFVFLLREPYIPLAALLYISSVVVSKKDIKNIHVRLSLCMTTLMTILVTVFLPLKDYVFSLFYVNKMEVASQELQAHGGMIYALAYSFLYPIISIFSGYSRVELLIKTIGVLFVILSVLYIKVTKKWTHILLIWSILGFAAIRPVVPGTVYWQAYRMLPWWALVFVSMFALFSTLIERKYHKFVLVSLSLGFVYMFFLIVQPTTFIWEKINLSDTFKTSYSEYFRNGEVARILSSQGDTYFVNDYDSLSFWQSGLDSSYKYALYYPVMTHISQYTDERESMFLHTPPTFYEGGDCDLVTNTGLSKSVLPLYTPLLSNGKPSCFYMLKDKLRHISIDQWRMASQLGYSYDSIITNKTWIEYEYEVISMSSCS